MKKTMIWTLATAALWVAALIVTSDAQTPQGDILRAKGRFLEGAGWYNLNTARADRINVETWKQYNREIQRLYSDFLNERHQHIQHKRGLGSQIQAEQQRKFREAQQRWRTKPNQDDITSGDALNALAMDLADPSIGPSSWRTAPVELPKGMSLTSLAFKIIDKKHSSIFQSVVALDRMLIADGWPLPFRRPEIDAACQGYLKEVTLVVDKCRKGTEVQGKDYDRLRDAVAALSKKVESDVPTRDNQRSQAREYVRWLDQATRIFADQSFAEQLLRDVSEHKATTIAELLGFMRQYRLLFSEPGSSPEVASLYQGLYDLLRRQKDSLGIANIPAEVAAAAARPSDVFKAGSVWTGVGPGGGAWTVTVMERTANAFKARFKIGGNVREIRGEVADDRISWRPQDVNTVKGAQAKGGTVAGATVGTFHGDELHLRVGHPNAYAIAKAKAKAKAKMKAMPRMSVLILHRAP